jgi:D-alanine-D-alanine ligase
MTELRHAPCALPLFAGGKVAILYDQLALDAPEGADTGPAEAEAVASVGGVIAEVADVVRRHGMLVETVALSPDGPTFLRQIADLRAELAVNLAESWAGRAALEAGVGWALAASGIPYTGAPPVALTLCLSKPLTRAVLAAHGVPIPAGATLGSGDPWPAALPRTGPWIVKPAAQDASHGIDAGSVVADAEAALARVTHLEARGLGPALVERYVDGAEVNVSIVELHDAPPRVLPIARIDFTRMPNGLPHILSFAGKWDVASPEYRGSESVEATDLTVAQRESITAVALGAWRALGLRGYGRVDLRLDVDGRPWVIDVNPNPDLSRDAGLCLAAGRAGLSFDQLVLGLLSGALHVRRP